jgi:hypothetical protein
VPVDRRHRRPGAELNSPAPPTKSAFLPFGEVGGRKTWPLVPM